MESSDKKKIIIMLVVMVAAMVGMSIFMRTGFQSFRHEHVKPVETTKSDSESKSDNKEDKKTNAIKNISLRINGTYFMMSVDEGEAGQEFAKSTPFELEMLELNGNEKYYEGDETLPTKEYKPEHIEAGDVMLYGDNTIVIFYKSFDTEFSYTRLGKIKGGENLEAMMRGEKVTVEFFK